jgi:hypothetical protein
MGRSFKSTIQKGGMGVCRLASLLQMLCYNYSGVRGGGKCPEEEHTTCSGGPTINCHKRGLRGERIFVKYSILQIL